MQLSHRHRLLAIALAAGVLLDVGTSPAIGQCEPAPSRDDARQPRVVLGIDLMRSQCWWLDFPGQQLVVR